MTLRSDDDQDKGGNGHKRIIFLDKIPNFLNFYKACFDSLIYIIFPLNYMGFPKTYKPNVPMRTNVSLIIYRKNLISTSKFVSWNEYEGFCY